VLSPARTIARMVVASVVVGCLLTSCNGGAMNRHAAAFVATSVTATQCVAGDIANRCFAVRIRNSGDQAGSGTCQMQERNPRGDATPISGTPVHFTGIAPGKVIGRILQYPALGPTPPTVYCVPGPRA